MTTPTQAIQFFTSLRDRKDINSRERQVALKRWAQFGETFFIRNGIKFTFTDEAINCDCGKGIHCPLVKTFGK